MIKIKKIVTKGFASLAALTMLNIGIAPAAYASDPSWHYDPAHPCAQCGEYDVEMPETWRQSSGTEYNGPNFLNEPYNRRVLHPCDLMFSGEGNAKHRSNFEDAGCGTHTWANLMLKTGMAQKATQPLMLAITSLVLNTLLKTKTPVIGHLAVHYGKQVLQRAVLIRYTVIAQHHRFITAITPLI